VDPVTSFADWVVVAGFELARGCVKGAAGTGRG